MKLSELLTIQAELNQHCKGQPKSGEDILWAIVAELGESANARKGEWGWWERDGKPLESESRDRQLDEWADVLCFLLTRQLNKRHSSVTDYSVEENWDEAWVKDNKVSLSLFITTIVSEQYSGHTLLTYCRFMHALGYTREEIEGAYLKKVQVNKDRWVAQPVAELADQKRQQAEAELRQRYAPTFANEIHGGMGDK